MSGPDSGNSLYRSVGLNAPLESVNVAPIRIAPVDVELPLAGYNQDSTKNPSEALTSMLS